MGEELSVVWELEVGHTVLPDQGLPMPISAEAFDPPATVGALVDAVRWGAVTSADPRRFQSPFRAGITLEPYQLEPLRRALASPRTNLLLADDVGLGKTIEAGLVIQELLLRHRARSVVIVCPPSLSVKWREEMRDRFGLDFTIVNSAALAEIRRTHGLAANPFRLYPRIIISMDWLPGQRAQRLLRDVLAETRRSASARRYAFDVLVVDEAHHVAPAAPTATAQGRGYAVDSQRTIAVRQLAQACEHRLFLSATPHNGYTESFTALLEMIDPRRFARGAEIDSAALDDVAVRRLKTQVHGAHRFQERRISSIPFSPTAEEESRFALLDSLLRESARGRGRKSLGIAALLLKKRFLSSPYAFARALDAQDPHHPLGGAPGDMPQAVLGSSLGAVEHDVDLAGPQDPVIGLVDPGDLGLESLVPLSPGTGRPASGGAARWTGRSWRPESVRTPQIGPGPEPPLLSSMNPTRSATGGPGSAWAKYALALRRISLARLSSRTSRSRSLMR